MENKEKNFKLTKRRIIVLLIAAVLLILIIFGISKLISSIFLKEKAYGNLSNKGFVYDDGGTVYYNKYDTGIYQVKGSKEVQITEENAYGITMYNDKLFYITIPNSIDIISVGTNGEGYQKIKTINTSIDKFYIEDNYLYYGKVGDTTGIAKLSLDNGEETIIIASNVKDFVLDNGTIYYTDYAGFLHSAKTTGTDIKDISTEYKIGRIQIVGKWIYFYDADEKALCRINKNGNSKSTVATFVNNETFNITNKYIYYFDSVNKQICRCDLKGKKSKPIVSISSSTTSINIANGVLYYLDSGESQIYQMYRVKTNGKAYREIVY